MGNPYLRDGVDIYVTSSNDGLNDVTFVFLSTRKRIHLKIRDYLLSTLPLMNGDNSIDYLQSQSGASRDRLNKFIEYLEYHGIVVPENWIDQIPLDRDYKKMLEKQLYFLLDILNTPDSVYKLQKKIKDTSVAIVGVGSIGSWILIELIQMGFEKFKLFDFKQLREDSIARHALFDSTMIGKDKSCFYTELGKKINPNIEIEGKSLSLTTDRSFLDFLSDVDIIVNCADDPYIGYSSIFLSRYAINKEKLLFVAGGFDAHLGCLGELIVPYKTPCADCYNEYFRESLKDWKPAPHPVKDRVKGFGGLASLSAFSASAGCLQILRYFIDEAAFFEEASGRGEFKFDDYSIDRFEVPRNTNCEVCGE
jgi:molybdopterin/thiamine biosynthesis adenylyltransferase